MSSSRLSSLLVQDGLVSAKKMAEAFQRQVIYGGTLDTILLEMDVIEEGALVDALSRANGVTAAGELPQAAALTQAKEWLPQALMEKCHAAPLGLDGGTLHVLVTDPVDRKLVDELGRELGRALEVRIGPELRFLQLLEMVYGAAVPARFAGLSAKLHKRHGRTAAPTPREVPRITAESFLRSHAAESPAPPVERERAAPMVVEPAATAPMPVELTRPAAPSAEPAQETREPAAPVRTVVTDLPMTVDLERQSAAPVSAIATDIAIKLDERPPAEAAPLPLAEATRAIDEAADRDAIFVALCRGARTLIDFAALLMVHGDSAAGRLALGAGWLDRDALARVAVPLDRPSPFRAAAQGRAPYLGRLGEEELGRDALLALGRKGPLLAVLVPIVLRERTVALLYGDANGASVEAAVLADLSTLVAAAARSFQRLILRAKGAEYAKAIPAPAAKLDAAVRTSEVAPAKLEAKSRRIEPPPTAQGQFESSAHWNAAPQTAPAAKVELAADLQRSEPPPHRRDAGGPAQTVLPPIENDYWRRGSHEEEPTSPGKVRTTAPGFPVLAQSAAGEVSETNGGAKMIPDASADRVIAVTSARPDLDALVEQAISGDARAIEALLKAGERGATAVVSRLPGPLRLERHKLRGPPPPLAEHGPLLALVERFAGAALHPLLARSGDPAVEVRYYCALALGQLRLSQSVQALGMRLFDPEASVRQVAAEKLARFEPSPELRTLAESLRGELPGPDAMRQRHAAEALGGFHDVTSVPRLIELVKHDDPQVVTAARRALIEITKQDFGTSRWRWRSWWERHRHESRIEWMLEGLGHAEAEVRMSASDELRGMTSEHFGYHFDQPKREREEARRKWVDWWRNQGSKSPTEKDR